MVACPTYLEKFIGDNVVAPFVYTNFNNIVTVTMPTVVPKITTCRKPGQL